MNTIVVVVSVSLFIALAAIVVSSVAIDIVPTGKPGLAGENGTNGATGQAGPSNIHLVYFAGTVIDVSFVDQYLVVNGAATDPAVQATPNTTNEWIVRAPINRMVMQWSFPVPLAEFTAYIFINDVPIQYTAYVESSMYVFTPPETISVGSVIKFAIRSNIPGPFIANFQMFIAE